MNNEEKILEMLTEMRGEITGMRGEMDEIRDTLTRVALTQENVVLPRLNLLAEGHAQLMETLAPKERVEVLEEEVVTLKATVKMISNRLSALEKAQ